MGFSKASSYTFSKPLDPQFVREVSVATFRVLGFTRPECFWTQAVSHRAVLLLLIAEIYLGFSMSLRRHLPACRGSAREPFLA